MRRVWGIYGASGSSRACRIKFELRYFEEKLHTADLLDLFGIKVDLKDCGSGRVGGCAALPHLLFLFSCLSSTVTSHLPPRGGGVRPVCKTQQVLFRK